MQTKFLIRAAAMFYITPEEITGKSRDQFLFYLRVLLTRELQKKGMRKFEIAIFLKRRKSTVNYYLKQFVICEKHDKKFNNYKFYFNLKNNQWRITRLQRKRKITSSKFQHLRPKN